MQVITKPIGVLRPYWAISSFGLFALCMALFFTAVSPINTAAQTIPTFSIVSVSRDQSVQIRTANFPPNTDFRVRMGPMGTRAINGTVVTIVNSGNGGVVDFSLAVPANLAGSGQIAIRLENDFTGHYAYNWFYNNSTAVAPQPPIIGDGNTGGPVAPDPGPVVPPHQGIPTFSITAVDRNNSVQILTNNFPPNTDFVVRMGRMGTQAINGVQIGFVNSGQGGTINWSFVVPAVLANQDRIAIRLESRTTGYYAFNWFFNNTTNPTPQLPILGDGGAAFPDQPGGGSGGLLPPPPITAYPTMAISNVVRNQSVTARLYNLSPNTTCTAQMGAHGSLGFGVGVGAFATDAGGTQDKTFTIPAELANSYRIAIRFDCVNGTYAFNWFYNNTASVPVP